MDLVTQITLQGGEIFIPPVCSCAHGKGESPGTTRGDTLEHPEVSGSGMGHGWADGGGLYSWSYAPKYSGDGYGSGPGRSASLYLVPVYKYPRKLIVWNL